MFTSVHRRILTAAVILGMAASGAGCAKKGPQPEATPTPDVAQSATATPTPGASTTPTPSIVYGPVWPLEPHTLSATTAPAPVLKAIHTGLHHT